jgi:hypothetical protein
MTRLPILLLLGAAACSTASSSSAPGTDPAAREAMDRERSNAETENLKSLVRVTSNPADVAGCRIVGVIGGEGPAVTFTHNGGTWYYDPPRKDTYKLGGNTLLTKDGEHGTAYVCPTAAKTP